MDASSQPGESSKSPTSRNESDSQPESHSQKSQPQEKHLLQASSISGSPNPSSSAASLPEFRTSTSPKQNPSANGSTVQDVNTSSPGAQLTNKAASGTSDTSLESKQGETAASASLKADTDTKPKSSVTLVSGRINTPSTSSSTSTTVTLSSSSTVAMKRPPSDILSTGGQQPTSSENADSDGSGGDPKRKKLRKEVKSDNTEASASGISQSGAQSPAQTSGSGTNSSSRNARATGSSKQSKSASNSSKLNEKQGVVANSGTQGGSTAQDLGPSNLSSLASSSSAGVRDSSPMEVDQDKVGPEASFSSRLKSSDVPNSNITGNVAVSPAPKVPPIKIVLPSHGHGSLNAGHSAGAASASLSSNESDNSGSTVNPAFPYVVSSTTDNSAALNSGSSPTSVSSSSTSVPGISNAAVSSPPDTASSQSLSSVPIKNDGSSGPHLGSVTSSSPSASAPGDGITVSSSNVVSTVSSTVSSALSSSTSNFSFLSSSTSLTGPSQQGAAEKQRAISPDNDSSSPRSSASPGIEKERTTSGEKEKLKDSSFLATCAVVIKDEKNGLRSSSGQNLGGGNGNHASAVLASGGPASNSSGSSDDKEKEKPQRVTRSSQRMAHSSHGGGGNGHGGSGAPNSPSGASPKGSNCPSPNQQESVQASSETSSFSIKQEPIEKHDLNDTAIDIHPKKRKQKGKEVSSQSSSVNTAAAEATELPQNNSSNPAHEQPILNCFEMFLNIRKQIERRRKNLFPVTPKPPQGFKDYLMNRGTYVLASNASKSRLAVPILNPPPSLSPQMKDMFVEQEKERHKLRIQHLIEKEKLVLSVEQEILRVHGRAARALSNQALPFSVCTILKDQEVYNLLTPEQEEKDRNARSRYNGRLFLSWLQDVDDKWDKIKESMLLRHHNEAESLHAVQKMDWEWKLKEVGLCEPKAVPVVDDMQVPMVHVSDDFDLLPA